MNTGKASNDILFPRLAFVSGLAFGGSTTFLCNLTGEMVRRGVPVIVVSPEKENPFASDFQARAVKVVLQRDSLIFEDRVGATLHALARFRPTAVIGCLGADSYEVLRYVPSGVRRIAVIQTDHPMFYDSAAPYGGYLDDIVGVSKAITRRLEKMDPFHAVRKHCLLHGVPIPETFQPRERSRVLRILYVGRITKGQKRVHLFPDILASLKQSGVPFFWTIAGEGEERTHLERVMASDRSDQQVIFTGPLPNTAVSQLLDEHDVFLLASHAEGLPISLLEAMAHGVVPVVSDLESGIRDIVDESNGILVPVDDITGYARGIIHLAQHRSELAAKSIACYERAKTDFSVEAMTDRWLGMFRPLEKPRDIEWPQRFAIGGPLNGSVLRHLPAIRSLRRLARRWITVQKP